jgi:predicted Rossmann fold nucleotide-binding protein DprA/Smf involved in DNA uptake
MSWTKDQVIALRNRAAARVQLTAPVVQEAEELTSLIATCEKLMQTSPTPVSEALRALAPIEAGELERAIPATSKVAPQQMVYGLLQDAGGEGLQASNMARELKLPPSTVASALRRLHHAGRIRRLERGRYACLA